MNSEKINGQIFESVKKQITIYPCEHLRASNIGHPCSRYLYTLIKHWEEQKPHDVGLQNIFNLGNSIEEYAIQKIKDAGFEVITPSVRAWRVEVKGGIISGREDIRIKDENGEWFPVEIKGLSPFEFDKLNCLEDFFRSKRAYVQGYPAQLMVYMLHFGKERGYFCLVNKLTGELKFIDVDLDYELGEKYLAKAESIYEALDKNEPPEACENIEYCESCPMAHVCGECKRVPADIELDDELDELINRKQELATAKKEYEQVDKEIKAKVGEREKVITGSYLITRKSFEKQAYTIPASTQWRMTIKKL